MKPILSFTLFGDQPKYYVGAEKNLIQAKEMLPDWEVRVYYHENMILDGTVKKLEDLGAKLINVKDLMIGQKGAIDFPFFWRFLAFFEDAPVMVRDLDSRLSQRELTYINGWLQSDCDYFIIRDHPWHAPVPSGLYGIKRKINAFEKHFIDFVNTQDLSWGADQTILYQYMQNVDKSNIYYCGFDDKTNYIPRDNKNFFIGMQLDENDEPTKPSGVLCVEHLNNLNL